MLLLCKRRRKVGRMNDEERRKKETLLCVLYFEIYKTSESDRKCERFIGFIENKRTKRNERKSIKVK